MSEKLKAQLGKFQVALNGLFDSERLAKLTPALRKQIEDLTVSLNEGLKGLDPIEMVKGAEQAAWGLEDLFYSFTRLMEMNAMANDQISGLIGKQTSTHADPGSDELQTVIDQRIASGDLLTKENHLTLLGVAEDAGKKAGIKEVEDRIAAEKATAALVETRSDRLKTLGLAVPGETHLAILETPETEFEEAVATATTRLEAHKGQIPEGHEAWPTILYAAPKDYDVLSAGLASLKTQAAPTGAAAGGKLNPMAAGGAGSGNDDSKPTFAGRF